MTAIPPMAWTDLATKSDLAVLEARLGSHVDRTAGKLLLVLLSALAAQTTLWAGAIAWVVTRL